MLSEKKLRKKAKKILKEQDKAEKPTDLILWSNRNVTLICVAKKELEMITDYFVGEGSFDVEDFCREVKTDISLEFSARLSVW